MTDHKITDDEVIHHLDCYENLGYRWCGYAIALINRQKAQIESLNAIHADAIESLRLAAEANKDMQAELERLNKEVDRLSQCVLYHDGIVSDLEKDLFDARAEAIKEFAQRLKPKLSYYDEYIVDALVKEMTEEQTNESQST